MNQGTPNGYIVAIAWKSNKLHGSLGNLLLVLIIKCEVHFSKKTQLET